GVASTWPHEAVARRRIKPARRQRMRTQGMRVERRVGLAVLPDLARVAAAYCRARFGADPEPAGGLWVERDPASVVGPGAGGGGPRRPPPPPGPARPLPPPP